MLRQVTAMTPKDKDPNLMKWLVVTRLPAVCLQTHTELMCHRLGGSRVAVKHKVQPFPPRYLQLLTFVSVGGGWKLTVVLREQTWTSSPTSETSTGEFSWVSCGVICPVKPETPLINVFICSGKTPARLLVLSAFWFRSPFCRPGKISKNSQKYGDKTG